MTHTKAEWQTLDAGGSPMRLFVVRPENVPHPPCIIVFQEAFGLNAHIRDVTGRIAALGYVAAAPELFHRTAPGFEGDYADLGKSKPHMEALTSDRLEEDIRAVHQWLSQDKESDASRMAAVGFCMGGKAAFIANALLPLKAGVSFYGSSIPSVLPLYAHRQQGPLLLVWGGQDKHIDKIQRSDVSDVLQREGKRFVQLEFSHAGHGFFCEERETYDPDAARESWAILAFLLKDKLQA
jgi:carboxymethylenebutenolidase